MLGIHQSFTGLQDLIVDANEIGADTFQFFIRNNRNLKMRKFQNVEFDYFNHLLMQSDIDTYVLHASYSINPASDEDAKRANAVNMIKEDMRVLSHLGGKVKYVLHPGSAVGALRTTAFFNLVDTINQIIKYVPLNVSICLEYMAGQGTQLICTPNEVKAIHSMLRNYPQVQYCFDTAHVYESGYDLDTAMGLLELEVGLSRIGVMHINNSATVKGSHVDRHAPINNGKIPSAELVDFTRKYTRMLPDVPFILETPADSLIDDYKYLKQFC